MLQEDGLRSRDPEAVLSEVEKGSADWRHLKLRKVMLLRPTVKVHPILKFSRRPGGISRRDELKDFILATTVCFVI